MIGKSAGPRWELDIVAYRGRDNLLQVVECKSYLDSVGVRAASFDGSSPVHAKRYKLFNDPELRRVVFNRMCLQFSESGACRDAPKVRLALAAGKIRKSDRERIRSHFEKNGWDLWDEKWLRQHLEDMARQGYENQVSAVVAKLLRRNNNE